MLTAAQLKSRLQKATTDDGRLKILITELALQNPPAFKYIDKAIALAEKNNDDLQLGRILQQHAIECLNKAEYKEGLSTIRKAKDIYTRHNQESSYYTALSIEGSYYTYLGLYGKAIDLLQKADKYFYVQKNDTMRIGGLVGLGIAYFNMEDYKTALSYFEKAAALKDNFKRNRKIAIYMNMGNCYNHLKDYKAAKQYFDKALREEQKDPNANMRGYLLLNIASLYLSTKDYKNANKYYLACDKHCDTHQVAVHVNACTRLAETYLKLNKPAEAMASLQKGKKLAGKQAVKDSELEEVFSMYYEYTGDYKKALKHFRLFNKYTMQTQENSSSQSLRNAQIAYETEIIQHERDTARKKSDELQEALDEVKRQKQIVEKEKKISEGLLLNILPASVADELKTKGKAEPKHFENVTVMFADIKGFTKAAEILSPAQLVNEIDFYFRAFDEIIGKYKIEKIKTIGDAYLCASGVPVKVKNSATEIVAAAIEMQQFVAVTKKKNLKAGKPYFEIRIGIHTGPLVAGIVGAKKFGYDIWGDTVNTAARMEQHGEVGHINISEATQQQIGTKFTCRYRGEVDAKNKGKLKMYFVG
jgi:adenylate cyclase